ncbi:uncharacterized protein [Dermacentor andersoni]|uniref:uncharacterized protein n=1 Tax=Dermacentor andersoni TaxID=34620 RepID=UPI003B3A8699
MNMTMLKLTAMAREVRGCTDIGTPSAAPKPMPLATHNCPTPALECVEKTSREPAAVIRHRPMILSLILVMAGDGATLRGRNLLKHDTGIHLKEYTSESSVMENTSTGSGGYHTGCGTRR